LAQDLELVEKKVNGAEPGTGGKKVNGTQFSVWIFRLGILDYLSRRFVYFGNFSSGQTKIASPFTIQPKISGFFCKW